MAWGCEAGDRSVTSPSEEVPGEASNNARWSTVLDQLEGEVENIEAAQQGPMIDPDEILALVNVFAPPSDLGPLPAEYAARAAAISDRQFKIMEDLMARITMSKRERDVAARYASRNSGSTGGVYYDGRG